MRMWLSGRASPCQGEGREFESRHPLHIRKAQKGFFRAMHDHSMEGPSLAGRAYYGAIAKW